MGVVYQARHQGLNRTVALKMLSAGPQAEARGLARFLAEAKAQAQVQHPNIVQVYEVGEADGRPYFALEYVEGGSLDRKVRGVPQPARVAAALVEVLARAIHQAHQRGLGPRDLKPANVLLTADGTPKVSDFGLAKCLQEKAGQTRTGDVVGTPSYMAPEQTEGQVGRVGPAADVYGLGAILYELLTGRPPFLAETALDTLLQVRSQEPVPVRRLQPKVPRDLETVCLKCLHKEPPKRYATAEALADDLRRFLTGLPIRARPVGAGERLWRWCRRNPLPAAAAALLLLTTATAFALITNSRDAALRAAADKDRAAARADAERDRAQRESSLSAFAQGLNLCRTAGQDGRVCGWKATEDQQVPNELKGPGRVIHAVAFSPDGQTVLTAGGDKMVRFWNAATGANPRTPPLVHQDVIYVLAVSPDGKLILTGSKDRTARLWDAATGRPCSPPLRHECWVRGVAFGGDGRTFLTACQDQAVRQWGMPPALSLSRVLPHSDAGPVRAVTFSLDGRRVLTVSGGTSQGAGWSWDVVPGRRRQPLFSGKDTAVLTAAIGPEGRPILTAGNGHAAQLWGTDPATSRALLLEPPARILAVALSPDGRLALTGGDDGSKVGQARFWDTATGQPQGPLLQHATTVQVVAFHPDGRTVATECRDGTVLLWDAKTGTPRALEHAIRHRDPIAAVAFSPDGRTLLTGSEDRTARLWDLATGRPRLPTLEHQDAVKAVAFSPDGRTVLTGSLDRTAQLWDATTGRPIGPPLPHEHTIWAVAYSPDSQSVLTGSHDRTARLWKTFAPVTGEAARLVLWVQVLTGLELDDDGRVQLLETATWRQRRQRLDELGGPPLP